MFAMYGIKFWVEIIGAFDVVPNTFMWQVGLQLLSLPKPFVIYNQPLCLKT